MERDAKGSMGETTGIHKCFARLAGRQIKCMNPISTNRSWSLIMVIAFSLRGAFGGPGAWLSPLLGLLDEIAQTGPSCCPAIKLFFCRYER